MQMTTEMLPARINEQYLAIHEVCVQIQEIEGDRKELIKLFVKLRVLCEDHLKDLVEDLTLTELFDVDLYVLVKCPDAKDRIIAELKAWREKHGKSAPGLQLMPTTKFKRRII
jgi:hypothetical protein